VFEKPARISQIRQQDQTFVFIEEHPDSMNDGALFVNMYDTGLATRIIDFPAAFHALGANLSFADGSVRFRQWIDARTTPAPRYNSSMVLNVSSANNQDILWLQSVTTYRK
jgi:prepilin-type processing-associated H-X9-DG protein